MTREAIVEQRQRQAVAISLLMVAVGVGTFLALARYGQDRWPAVTSSAGVVAASASGKAGSLFHVSQLFHLLLALAIVAVAGRLVSIALRPFRQPPVMGQILAGILLGPSLLGRFAPAAADFVLPETIAPYLGLFSQVGVILFMFVVGLELDSSVLRRQAPSLIAISQGSIVVPFLLGSGCAVFLYTRLSSPEVPFLVFALFSGIAVAVTAFPVLSRILTDRRMHRSPIGTLALACASVGDFTAWCLLAVILGVAQANLQTALWTLGFAAFYMLVMMTGARKLIGVYVERHDGPVTATTLALVVVGVLSSALVTDWIGIHAIFGAFLLGALVPRDSAMARDLVSKIEPLVGALLLPAFFAFTGMRTEIGLVSGVTDWLLCGLLVLMASLGKFGGSCVLARFSGMSWRDSAVLGILMNTRGLMELIVLNIGLDMKIISPKLFTMYVLMSLVTTLATTPIFDRLTQKPQGEPAWG